MNSLLSEGDRLLRELAVQQGLAYCAYGEALQQFGEKQIGLPGLMKSAGDLYARETVHTTWSLIRTNANIYAWLLSMVGTKPLRPEPEAEHDELPTGGRARRGRG